MTLKEFVDSRTERVDINHLAKTLYERKAALDNLGIVACPWSASSEQTHAEWQVLARVAARTCMSDIYDKMSPGDFEGCYDAQQVAIKLFNRIYEGTKPTWPMIGSKAQDTWVQIAMELMHWVNAKDGLEPRKPVSDHGGLEFSITFGPNVSVQEMRALVQKQFDECLQKQGTHISRQFMEPDEEIEGVTTFDSGYASDPHTEIFKDRGEVYGPMDTLMEASGLTVTGLIEAHYQMQLPHPIPGSLLCLMNAACKLVRASVPYKFHEDNYLDGRNYITMAEKLDDRNPANVPET